MKLLISLLLCLICASGLIGQTATTTTATATPLAQNIFLAGFGFQSTANPQTSGWSELCHANPSITLAGLTLPSYTCAATDYTTTATSARVDIDTAILHKSWLVAGTKTGGGAAVNGAGVGGSFALGGWAMADISGFTKISGAHLAASVTWQKDDVVTAVAAGTAAQVLQSLGARAAFRFGVGRAW